MKELKKSHSTFPKGEQEIGIGNVDGKRRRKKLRGLF